MRRASTTFFNSSLFFPARVRSDVTTLYAFVRTADDFVDSVPQDRDGFFHFRDDYLAAAGGREAGNPITARFVELATRRGFEKEWVESFLSAMEQDLWKTEYSTLAETEEYMRGSAETVGLMMARVLALPYESLPYARLMGKAFQYLNFIRDVREDLEMHRIYIPGDAIAAAGLTELSVNAALRNPREFRVLISGQLARYWQWRREAARGYRYIPRRYFVAIKTAADMFDFTALQIERNPAVVMERKVKPARARVIASGIRNLVAPRAPRGHLAVSAGRRSDEGP